MFESSRYEKMKKQETEKGYSELKILVAQGVDKTHLKNLTNKIKECFKNLKIVKKDCYEIYALAEEYPLETALGEIMELIALCKVGETIKFYVNAQEYVI